MTLREAILSGKQFRRRGWDKSYDRASFHRDLMNAAFSLETIMADDWETKPEPMVVWANVYPQLGTMYAHENESNARMCRGNGGVTKKFIEVIE